MEPDLSLEGRVAVVTGAAGGVGSEIARTFAAHGATLVVVDAVGADGGEIAKEIGGGTVFLPCDVGDPDAVASMVEAVVEKHGRLDILVSAASAGLALPGGAGGTASLPDEEFSRAALLALNGSFYCAKYAAERMAARGAGCILTVTAAAWAAAAAAAAKLAEEMAGDLGPRGLRVAAIAAGPRATPVDVAHAALFLASDMAVRVNGAVLAVGT